MPAEKDEAKEPRARPRLIVLIASFLVSHSTLFSVVCCIAGLIALLLLPVLAKSTYISENALMPGSANPVFSGQDVSEASRLVKDITETQKMGKMTGIEIQRLIIQRMADVGAEVYHHKFHSQSNQFHPFRFFSCDSNSAVTESNSNTSYGLNTVGIIRAPRGDGKEAIVLVTPYNSEYVKLNDALSLGLGFSIFSHLGRVSWLAKDILWLAADSRYGEYSSVSAWLKDYHNPVFFSSENVDANVTHDKDFLNMQNKNMLNGRNVDVFKRAGTMAAALVFKVGEVMERDPRDILTIYAEASNGQMPNLDLINVVHYLAVHRQGFRVNIGKLASLVNSAWLNLVGQILEWLGKLAKNLNPKWNFGISSADYAEGAATVASSMYHQALGVPTGSHGAFRDYQVDAITFSFSPRFYLNNENMQSSFILRGGRLIEGVIRSVNNLLEKFHQSFFLYMMTAPNKFVSVGVYMIGFALLALPLPVVAASLFLNHKATGFTGTEEAKIAFGSWKWLYAAKTVLMIDLWAMFASLMPYFISQIPNITSTESTFLWVALSVTILAVLYVILGSPPYSHSDWCIAHCSHVLSSSSFEEAYTGSSDS
ncbi:GPI transamidase component Gaa1 protein [Dioscorea alata]|uniref:GPI transamidase component Gaa1 protein n=1 Tax=Dioscorea alata TaxID=55571 RepID=A0ACB7VRZ4_DIOAL|nr:GPI transamidase component Gaa1 protein [Dioscorea alata]